MKKTTLISSLLVCACLLSACGQRGPLYMPEKKSPAPQQAIPVKAPSESPQEGK
ncbi:lipoprotein [Undibacterium sp. LX40W]|uniref:LPS translocon maturation chaperone LptM n=1 Tax=Undibacterium TaxID=401469 RepID=UPI001C9A6ADA|nr:lipoprotein [Undibacterium sp. LX40W]